MRRPVLRPADQDEQDEPTRVGAYRVIEKLGDRGVASLYLAERSRAGRRRVALKVVKPAYRNGDGLARFDRERRALERMSHPNIARITDTGLFTPDPSHFAMELVPGLSLVAHCDEMRLTLDERLSLMVQVAGAVDHAHQKGFLHLDLRSENLLVANEDGRAVPKIIDFGNAKGATNDEGVGLVTAGMPRTPDYMSPEQASSVPREIDRRTDVYSLGVVLYELLVGHRPFDLRRKSSDEIRNVLSKSDPPPPEIRFATAERRGFIAARRGLTPRTLAERVRGDLSFMTMRALAKDPAARYESAAALAEDLDCYLKGMPLRSKASSPGCLHRALTVCQRLFRK